MKKTIQKTLMAGALSLSLFGMSQQASADTMPGLAGGDHLGLTVPNVAEATTFLTDVIGCQAFYPLGPFADDQGTWMADHLNVHPRATIPAMRLVRCGSGLNLELFEYTSPDQNTSGPKNSDIGGHHIAFYVTDMDAAVNFLRANDVQVLGNPTTMTAGPSTGETWVYFLSPWGTQMELVSYPNGKAYEENFDGRLWDPR